MLYEFAPSVIDASIEKSALARLIIVVLLPIIGAYFLIEFASFSFSLRNSHYAGAGETCRDTNHWKYRCNVSYKAAWCPYARSLSDLG